MFLVSNIEELYGKKRKYSRRVFDLKSLEVFKILKDYSTLELIKNIKVPRGYNIDLFNQFRYVMGSKKFMTESEILEISEKKDFYYNSLKTFAAIDHLFSQLNLFIKANEKN